MPLDNTKKGLKYLNILFSETNQYKNKKILFYGVILIYNVNNVNNVNTLYIHNLCTHSTWHFEQVNEVCLMEEMYCMHLAGEKTHYSLRTLN